MGLKGDVDEITTVWKRAPWRVKIFYSFSFFLAVSSIASLSDIVADWKGFLLTGVEFYREWFREPVFSWISKVTPLVYNARKSDILTVAFINSIAYFRVDMHDCKRYVSFMGVRFKRPGLKELALPTTIVIMAMAMGMGSSIEDSIDNIFLYVFLLLYIYSLVFTLYLDIGARVLLLKVYLVVPPLFVCFLAAINLGLRS